MREKFHPSYGAKLSDKFLFMWKIQVVFQDHKLQPIFNNLVSARLKYPLGNMKRRRLFQFRFIKYEQLQT